MKLGEFVGEMSLFILGWSAQFRIRSNKKKVIFVRTNLQEIKFDKIEDVGVVILLFNLTHLNFSV